MEFKDKLLLLRKENHLSQQDLANQFNVSRQSVSKWELGESLPDMNNVILLSELYHVTTDYLLKDTIDVKRQTKDKSQSILVISSIIILLGAITGHILWTNNQDAISLLIGIMIQMIGIGIFEFFVIYTHNEKIQKTFFSINIWLLTLLPICYFIEYTKTFSLINQALIQPIVQNQFGILLYMYMPLLLSLLLSAILFAFIRKVF